MWLVSDSKERAAIKELDQASDRTVGIISGAIIDSKLSEVLMRALGDDSPYSKKIRSELFRPDGPLGNFRTKIKCAYLIGLLTEEGCADMQTFTKIRNRFVHYAEDGTFGAQRITALCRNFNIIDKRVFEQVMLVRGTEEQQLRVDLGAAVIENRELHMALKKKDGDTSNPKWRFASSAKLFCATLDTYLHAPESLNVPLF